jgi:hypothetical protein
MQFERDAESGDFKFTGTTEDAQRLTGALRDAWDAEDEMVVGLTQAIENADGGEVAWTFERAEVPDVADVLEGASDPELAEEGAKLQTAMSEANVDAAVTDLGGSARARGGHMKVLTARHPALVAWSATMAAVAFLVKASEAAGLL